jgi:hypothetical protein
MPPDQKRLPDLPADDGPKVPMEEWSVEEPFDCGVYLMRMAVGPDDGEEPPAEQ